VNEDRFFKAALAVVVLFVAGVVLKLARPVLVPFVLAVFLSYIVDPALTFLARRFRFPKSAAMLVVLALMFVLLYLLGVLVYSSGKAFVAELPKYQDRIGELTGLLRKGLGPFRIDLSSVSESLDIGKVGAFILKAIGPFVDLLGKLLLVFLFLVFILAGRGRAGAKLTKVLGEGRADRVAGVIEAINGRVQKYLVIKTAVSLANGLMVWIVLTLFGVDFAALFGLLAFLLNYIPNIGSAIAAVVRVAFVFFQFGTFWTPFWILVITVGLDTALGNLVEPRIMGKGLGLSPLLVFFSLLFWGWLWGIPGMILSVPLTALIRIVCQNIPPLRPVAVMMGP
jgi:AI-2 transport protein TqsA